MTQAIVDEAKSWLNTPYHPHARIKGVGVDCAMLLAEVYERAGVIPHVDPGHYSPQFGLHRSEEVFKRFVELYGTEIDGPEPGCCVLFKYGRCFSHGAVMVSEREFVHASLPVRMVCLGALSDAEVSHREKKFYKVASRGG